MEIRSRRPGFSLDALIAEAKRRARQRRLLVLLLLVVVAAVAAAVTFGSSGGGSRPGGASGAGGLSGGSRSVQIGPFSVSVPQGFHTLGGGTSPGTGLTISNVVPLSPSGVELDIGYFSSAPAPFHMKQLQLPLDLQKLHPGGDGRTWNGLVSGGGSIYSVLVAVGRNATAADRASILGALSSIRRRG